MRNVISVAAALVLACAVTPAHADVGLITDFHISVDGQELNIPVDATAIDPDNIAWYLSGSSQTPDYGFQFHGAVDTDPFVSYGFSVTNYSSSPLTVSNHFSIGVWGGPWDTLSSSLSISGAGKNGFDIEPTGASIQQASVTPDLNSLGIGLGGGCSAGKALMAVGCYAVQSQTVFGLQNFTMLDLFISFNLTGVGSRATVNGGVELTRANPALNGGEFIASVPEPGIAGMALPMVGLIMLSFRKLRTLK